MKIRPATLDDAEQILAIYRPIVEETVISFELTAPTVEEMRKRIQAVLQTHAWLVADNAGEIDGYAYGSVHRPRQAYQFAVEVSAYVHRDRRGQGIARALYQSLFDRLRDSNFHVAFAGIALPNDASIALHKSMGFQSIGVFREIGYKFDQWHDVAWWQRKF